MSMTLPVSPQPVHQLAHYNPPSELPWCPVYQDDHILIVDKPAGLLTVPGRGDHVQDCLIFRVQRHCPQALIVHRLDMATSGLVVLGKGAAAQRALSQLFMQRLVDKQYQAWVHGHPQPSAACIDLPLMTDWANRPKQKVDADQGKPSKTHYQVLGVNETGNMSRLLLTPLTGRSHQLRVHCLAIGHPIVGDNLYGEVDAQGHSVHARLMLHATELTFNHPFTQAIVSVSSRCPF
jgi:tRNA pseudouridine32 synthase / 23S rRNA pseudouridine746 synthase